MSTGINHPKVSRRGPDGGSPTTPPGAPAKRDGLQTLAPQHDFTAYAASAHDMRKGAM